VSKIVGKWVAIDKMDFSKQLGFVKYKEKGKKLFPETAE